MTTRHSQSTEQKHHQRFVLPDPPEREPEDMTSFDHLTLNGSGHHLVQHLGNPQTTLVAGERYITREPGAPAEDRMAPDLLVAFNADLQAYRDSNGYIISEQGKPPDFVLEIASRSTAGSMTYRLMVVGMMNAPPIITRPMATPMREVLAWAIR